MNYPTPYGKSDDLALENERLRGLVKEMKREARSAEERAAQEGMRAALEGFAAWIDPGTSHGLNAAIRGACAKYALQYRDHLTSEFHKDTN